MCDTDETRVEMLRLKAIKLQQRVKDSRVTFDKNLGWEHANIAACAAWADYHEAIGQHELATIERSWALMDRWRP